VDSTYRVEFSAAERRYFERRKELSFLPPAPDELPLIPQVLTIYEGAEAIYQDWGILRVRVLNLHHHPGERRIHFDVEEVSSPGLGLGSFKPLPDRLRRWRTSIYFHNMTTKSWRYEDTGANFKFDPDLIAAVVNHAAALPSDMDPGAAYREVGRIIIKTESLQRLDKETLGKPIFPTDKLLKEYRSAISPRQSSPPPPPPLSP
jgi:hypothetical protein